MALSKAQRRYKNRGPRRSTTYAPGGENRVARRTPITATFDSAATPNATFVFDQPVVVSGVPQWFETADEANVADSVVVNSPTSITLHFPSAITTAITIPFEDPHVRNMAGGYVLSGVQSFPS